MTGDVCCLSAVPSGIRQLSARRNSSFSIPFIAFLYVHYNLFSPVCQPLFYAKAAASERDTAVLEIYIHLCSEKFVAYQP